MGHDLMAMLPTAADLGQRPIPTPNTSIVPVKTGQVENALDGVGEAINRIDQHLTEARRASQLSDALGKATEALGTKEVEFQRDQDFKTAPMRFKEISRDIGIQHGNAIDDPVARQVFQRDYAKLAAAKQLGVVTSAAKQEADYNHAALSANLDTFAIAAANAGAAGNTFDRKVTLDNARTAIGEMRGGNGRPGWITDQQAKALEDRFQINYFDAWAQKDPVGALNELTTNQAKIRPDLALRLQQHLFQRAAPVLAQQVNAAGGTGVVGGESPAPGQPKADLPRGIRNNNPGNIQRTSTPWQGEVPGGDPRYSAFETPEAGIRALGKNLLAYQDQHDLNTVAGIVSRWAPATENDTGSYVKTVASALHVDANAPLNLRDPSILAGLTKAIIGVENGNQPYSDTQVSAGVDAALSGKALPAVTAAPARAAMRDASLPSGVPLVDALPPDQKLHVLQMARVLGNKDQSAAREALKGQIQDTVAAYISTGAAPNRPQDDYIMSVEGQARGLQLIRHLNDQQQLGQSLQQVKTLPDRDIEALVESSKPVPGEGYAQRLKDWKKLEEAGDTVRSSRRADPVGYAVAAGSFGVKPIQNLGDPEAVATELAARARAAPDIMRDYGTAPALLSKPEATALAGALKVAPVEAQKTYLATLYHGVGDDMGLFKVAMKQVAPDAPVLAVAGLYQGRALKTPDVPDGWFSSGRRPTDVADLILRGNAILHPQKAVGQDHEGGKSLIKMPPDKDLLNGWTAQTGEAFKGKEEANDLFQQTARSIYAARAAEDGDFSGNFNAKRWKQSIDFATGGIESHNGSEVVLPYGTSYDKFKDGLAVRAESLAKTSGVTADELTRLPLESVGDGRYIFRRGTGYVVDKDGRPVTVNFLTEPPPAMVVPPVEIANPSGFAVTKAGAVTGIPKGRK